MKKPKRHHYLPQFYLFGFSDAGRLVVFDERRNEVRFERPLNTAVRRHYYSFVDDSGAAVSEVESDLARIEGRAAQVFTALASRQAISTKDRYNLSVFLGFLACRTPAFERSANEALTGLAEVVIRKNLEQPNADGLFGASRNELLEFLDSGDFALEYHPNYRISHMIDLGPRLGRDFFLANWAVLHTDRRNLFITSDNPFAIVHPERPPEDLGVQRYGIASPEVTTSFPLSSRECLLMSGASGALAHVSAARGQVRRINLATALEAEDLVIGRDESQIRKLVCRAKLGPGRRKPKQCVKEFSHPSGDPERSSVVTGRRRGDRE